MLSHSMIHVYHATSAVWSKPLRSYASSCGLLGWGHILIGWGKNSVVWTCPLLFVNYFLLDYSCFEVPRWLSCKEYAWQARDAGDEIWSLGQEDLLEKEMTTHPSILAWKIPWTEEPFGLQSMRLQSIGHDLTKQPSCFTMVCCPTKWISYTSTFIPLFLFPSHLGHRRVLSRVPCAIQ